ncbi:putative capsid scaffold protein [Idiomarinaceae phage Phi1M2-2]|uniref:putative capsid scaffold protein n=1 Tax=Idiomarinaceae phage Phi1M2-2 TaxID=1527515 RepID=UPI0004F92D2F|nr:putative capsid scaffold protein [Idiomarinaceae phage Phi1M2-2]AIM40764.1 putative capsid scaffold protein [Idiomarinaceae phage Phi1M2-2]
MFVEKLDDLPESLQDQFEPYELDGKKGFQHKDTIALANSLKNAKAEKAQTQTQLEEFKTKLEGFEQQQAKAIEDARAAALEEARSKGDVKAIEERYQQQMEDLRKRVEEETRATVTKEFTTKQAQQKANSIADKIGLSTGIDADAGEAIADLIRSRVEVDPDTGKEVYKDAKGGALSVDRDGFIAELKKERRFKFLMKGVPPSEGGGNANGSSSGGAATKQATRDEFNSWTPAKQKEFAKSGGKIV